MSDSDWAAFCWKFWKAKLKQNLNKKADDCKNALKAANLPIP